MKKSEAATNLIDYIDAQIMAGIYPPGTKLPSLRSLARKFRISYSTALRGINYLEEQGKLRKSPQSGVYVLSPVGQEAHHPEGDRCIAVITPRGDWFDENMPGIFHSALTTIKSLILSYNYSLLIMPQPLRGIPPEMLERINRLCSGVILMKEIDEEMTEMPLTVPAVAILTENDYNGKLSIVGLDPFNAAYQALGYFRERGVSRLHLVVFDAPVYRTRALLLENLWRENGGEIVARSIFRRGEIPRLRPVVKNCGYFFTSDNLLYSCVEHFRQHTGTNLPDTCPVLAVDGKSLVMPWNMRMPTIAVDWKQIGRLAFAECLARIENPLHTPRRIYLPGTLVNRQELTCGGGKESFATPESAIPFPTETPS